MLLTCLGVLFAVAGGAVGEARLAAFSACELRSSVGRSLPVTAVLTDLPAIGQRQVTLAVRVTRVGQKTLSEPAHLRLRLGAGETVSLDACGPLVEGTIVHLPAASIGPLPSPKPGAFDYGRYLRRRGEHVVLEGRFADLQLLGRRGGLRGVVDRLRLASRAHLRAGVHPPVRDVLDGMVLGDDEGVDEQTIEAFRRSGLLHIMAVSGENVVLLCGMWSFAFAALGVPRLTRTLLLMPLVVVYVVLTGASPSIVRAGVSGVVGLLAIMVSRPTDGWLLWLAPAAWLLTVNPNNLFDVSFQLSFAAVAGLLVLARPLTRWLRFLPRPLPEQVGVTTAASLATAPVSMLTFGSTSIVAVPANVAGGFVLGPIMFLGMLSLLVGFLSSWLSAPLNMVAGLFIGFLLEVSRLFARPSWAVLERQGLSLGLLLAVALLSELAVVVWLARRAGEGPIAYVRDRGRSLPLAAVAVATLAVVVLLAPAPVGAPRRPTLTFLSVGEGAATLVQIPHGPTILIDAGPTPLARTLRARGVRKINLLVLSHGHADHVAGLEDVIGRIPIEAALMPRPANPSAALDRIERELRAAGTAVRRCTAPLVTGGTGWSLRVLATRPPPGESGNQGENDTALVALVGLAGQQILVPGDAEGEVLEPLDLPPCAVVELPHHGSRGGLDEAELEELAPRLGVISVGPNTYGHPTAEMLDLLAEEGVPCARTDQCGDIAVSAEGGGLKVSVGR
jgi:competence protein ComEC